MAIPTRSWCLTTTELEEFRFEWTINNFSICPKQFKEVLESSQFSSGSNELVWLLELYPRGYNDEVKDNYLSLFLKLVSTNKPVVCAKYNLSIRNRAAQTYTYSFVKGGGGFGTSKFIGRDILFDKANGLLPDDKLTIICEISVTSDSVNVSGRETPVEYQVPKCRLAEDFQALFIEKKLTDVTLSVSEQEFHVHKIVLAARSPVFSAMFNHEMAESQNNRVEIKDVEPNVMNVLLQFIYTGNTPDIDDIADLLLAAADKYGLERLKVICEKSLGQRLSTENVVDIMSLAELHSASQLQAQVVKFISAHTTELLKMENFTAAATSHPRLLMEAYKALAAQKAPLDC